MSDKPFEDLGKRYLGAATRRVTLTPEEEEWAARMLRGPQQIRVEVYENGSDPWEDFDVTRWSEYNA